MKTDVTKGLKAVDAPIEVLLFDRAAPAYRLSMALVLPAAALTAAFFAVAVAAGLRAQFLPVRAGAETLAGALPVIS